MMLKISEIFEKEIGPERSKLPSDDLLQANQQ